MATFTNQATLTYNGQTTTSNVTVGELVETLTAAKTAVVPAYEPDGRITYVISLVNSGAAPLTGLTVTDDLGGYTFNGTTVYPLSYTAGSVRYYQNGALQTAPTVTAGPPLVFTGITVSAGGNAVIAYEAAPTTAAPRGVAELVTAAPRLSISKSLSPTTLTENGQLTYTFALQNTGNTAADAAAGAVVTDTFDPRLSGLTVTLNGTALTTPAQYTYDAATGVFATVPGVINVPAATYTQDAATGAYSVTPGTAVLTVTGTV